MEQPKDADLWRLSLNGEGSAFAQIFDRHQQRVYRHAHRLTANAEDSEDLTAGAFLELWRRRKDVRLVDDSVLPWLLVTVTNLGRNHSRKLQRHRTFIERLRRESTEGTSIENEESDGLGLLDEPWARALARLGPTDARLITLVVLEDQPLEVAAKVLGLSTPAVKSRMHRARKRLREEWDSGGASNVTRAFPGGGVPSEPAAPPLIW